eukprot:TRINITY_DN23625_c0_g1_i2.p1 TRINITY_DN23625_c0_g1~~TRINITY_DN23625_c0_g1_i2.p1  ORF type:complete len:396 (+),score=66.20 TRINITY_DN23625_c0_g1_i2:167-1354(+)
MENQKLQRQDETKPIMEEEPSPTFTLRLDWYFLGSGILLLYAFGCDLLFGDDLEEHNNRFVIHLQRALNESAVEDFFLLVLQLGNAKFLIALNTIYFAFSAHKHLPLLFAISTTCVGSLSDLLKIVYHRPRPYHISKEVKAWDCDSNFGMPSAHAMVCTFAYLTLARFLFLGDKTRYFQEHEELMGKTTSAAALSERPSRFRKFYMIGTWIALLLVYFCRIYLGAHSVMQVVIGALFGFLLYRLLIMNLDYALLSLRRVIRKEGLNGPTLAWNALKLFYVIHVIVMLIPVMTYWYLIRTPLPKEWYQNYTNKCGAANPSHMFYHQALISEGVTGLAFGLIYACLISSGIYRQQRDAIERWNKVAFFRKLVRWIIGVAVFDGVCLLYTSPSPRDQA